MSAPKVYGWCPGALRPMMSGDGLVVRVRAPLGRLTQDQAAGVADLSHTFGNGLIDLSARANLQLRGVTQTDHPALIDGLRRLDLIDDNIAVEARRNIMVQPFWSEGDDTHSVALALNQALSDKNAPTLPGKFGFAVDCGPAPFLTEASCDIRIERGEPGLICRCDGAEYGVATTIDAAAQTALSMAQWFLDNGGVQNNRGRMKALVSSIGAPDGAAHPALPTDPAHAPGAYGAGILLGLEFGQTTADTLAKLAQIAPLRLTPWRAVLLEGATQIPAIDSLISDSADPRLTVSVCTGAPGCMQGQSATRTLARTLAPFATKPLHVSGCTKGCAHPGASPITLTATADGRFNLIRDGRASDIPEVRDLTLNDLMTGEL